MMAGYIVPKHKQEENEEDQINYVKKTGTIKFEYQMQM